jgi:hypothetical protein
MAVGYQGDCLASYCRDSLVQLERSTTTKKIF